MRGYHLLPRLAQVFNTLARCTQQLRVPTAPRVKTRAAGNRLRFGRVMRQGCQPGFPIDHR
ncbi:MAG: hypothetical protein AW08_01276 [Candidatus Accumulibacter adjunctus]|uniref:Uncharacterized protein n=1 Tax=Candidatus Accumulibacter adjunctus TaxID=1454001 RepID=A0A011PQB0_9PROT|nr:MAG: hypothetical protein AW08_01276 [Candidatus Accumulibacter adjunctus]